MLYHKDLSLNLVQLLSISFNVSQNNGLTMYLLDKLSLTFCKAKYCRKCNSFLLISSAAQNGTLPMTLPHSVYYDRLYNYLLDEVKLAILGHF